MDSRYASDLNHIVEKLQLEEEDSQITISALIEIFSIPEAGKINSYEYPIDKSGVSQINLLSEEVGREESSIGKKLLYILLMSEKDFESELGINDSEGGPWFHFRGCIMRGNQMKTGSAKILATKRSQKIKAGEFDALPHSRKYGLMHYCVNVDKNLFTEEEVVSEKEKVKTDDDRKARLQILLEYDRDKAVDEIIEYGYYNFMFNFPQQIFTDLEIAVKIKKMCRNEFTPDEIELFNYYTETGKYFNKEE